MWYATGISSTGSSASEIRMVSPMPYGKSCPRAAALFIAPGSFVPASVTPRCNGASEWRRNSLLASTISGTWLAVRETLKLVQPISSAISTFWSALATSASAFGRSQNRFSTEPELTPMRIATPVSTHFSMTAR